MLCGDERKGWFDLVGEQSLETWMGWSWNLNGLAFQDLSMGREPVVTFRSVRPCVSGFVPGTCPRCGFPVRVEGFDIRCGRCGLTACFELQGKSARRRTNGEDLKWSLFVRRLPWHRVSGTVEVMFTERVE